MTTAREVVEACAHAAYEYDQIDDEPSLWPKLPDDDAVKRVYRGMALAVIRALAAAGSTDAMDEARRQHPPAVSLRAMLTALADGYERERDAPR